MSVRVYPDTGPSYAMHEPTPGSGPAVCSRCVHVCKGALKHPQFCKSWTCGAVPGTVIRQARTDPITGEDVSMIVSRPSCTARNAHGNCQDFIGPSARHDGSRRLGEIKRGEPRMDADKKVDVSAALLASITCLIVGVCLGALLAWT